MITAVDTESDAQGNMLCTSMAAMVGPLVNTKVVWVGEGHPKLDGLESKIFHNAKYDLQVLANRGYVVGGEIHDTMLMAKCVEERLPSYSLKHLGYYLLGDFHLPQAAMENWFVGNGQPRYKGDMGLLPRAILNTYTRKDVELTLRLYHHLWPLIVKHNLVECYHTEMATLKPIMQMESNCVEIDRPWVVQHEKTLQTKIANLKMEGKAYAKENKIQNSDDFNPNSIPQIARILMAQGFALPSTEKGNTKLDKRTRKNIEHPLVKIKGLLEESQKTARTYCANLLEGTRRTHKVSPNFRISYAATRRFSSARIGDVKLNWQNFPKEMRRAVAIPKGRVGWFFDYSQIENIIHIFFSEDEERRQAYCKDPTWSEYLWLSERILGRRITKEDPEYKRIKATKLGMNYGLGYRKFAMMNGIPGTEARRLYDTVSRACPSIKKLQKEVAVCLEEHGYVRDVFGYIYHGSPRMAYKVVAYLIQGCAAALMKHAIIRAGAIAGVQLHLTVHDELFFTTAHSPIQWGLARKVKHAMTDFPQFGGIPIRITAFRSTTNWKDREEVLL